MLLKGVFIRDETLLKLSFLTSIIGIILLFVFAQALETEKMNIEDIDKTFIGKNVEVFADITSFYESNGNYFLKLTDKTGNITAVLFKNDANKVDTNKLKKGVQIKLNGKISEYKGYLEIIADKIEFI